VDTQGNLLRVWVHAADLADQAAAAWWIDHLVSAFPTLKQVFADNAYRGDWIAWAHEHLGLTVEIVKKLVDQQGFVVLPRRWVVERTIAWSARCRRLTRDFEYWPECSQVWLYLASIRRLVRRLAAHSMVS
jgi:transposase